jgi:hypothetical protein
LGAGSPGRGSDGCGYNKSSRHWCVGRRPAVVRANELTNRLRISLAETVRTNEQSPCWGVLRLQVQTQSPLTATDFVRKALASAFACAGCRGPVRERGRPGWDNVANAIGVDGLAVVRGRKRPKPKRRLPQHGNDDD